MLVALLDEERGRHARRSAPAPRAHVRSLIALMPFGHRAGRSRRALRADERRVRARRRGQCRRAAALSRRSGGARGQGRGRRRDPPLRRRRDALGRHGGPPRRSIPTSRSRSRIAGARGLGDAAVLLSLKDNERGNAAQAPGRAGDQDAGGRPARRRRRARFQQHPDRDHRPLRPDADAPLARRQRL